MKVDREDGEGGVGESLTSLCKCNMVNIYSSH